jgi:hypothetical protein
VGGWHRDGTSAEGSLKVGTRSLAVGAKFEKLLSPGTSFGLSASFQGIPSLEMIVTRLISRSTQVGCALALNPGGVTLKLRTTRWGHTFSLPLILFTELTAHNAAIGLLVACGTALAAQYGVLVPRQRLKEQRKKERIRKESQERVAEAKREAERDLMLMETKLARRIDAEERVNGPLVSLRV